MRIAIVTHSFADPSAHCGIGSAYRRLAELLHQGGHSITVVLTLRSNCHEAKFLIWQERYRRRGIELLWLPDHPATLGRLPWYLHKSYSAYRYLRGRQFDVVHFPDCLGVGYHTLLAKRRSEVFGRTCIVVGAHGTTTWAKAGQSGGLEQPRKEERLGAAGVFQVQLLPHERAIDRLETRTLQWADQVICPTRYMVDHLQKVRDLRIRRVRVIGHPNWAGGGPGKDAVLVQSSDKSKVCNELVFLGRLESRKGFHLFIEALNLICKKRDRVADPIQGKKIPVYLLGSVGTTEGIESPESVLHRSNAQLINLFDVKHLPLGSTVAREKFLRDHPRALVCVPSRLDNAPLTIVESLESKHRLITTSQGGQAELLSAQFRPNCVIRFDARALAELIEKHLEGPVASPRPSRLLLRANQQWLEFHRFQSLTV